MWTSRGAILLSTFLLSLQALADNNQPKFKYGEIKSEDFNPTVYSIDSNASAIILANIGKSSFEGNTRGGFNLKFDQHKRIRLINKNGFSKATIQIFLYKDGNSEEKLEKLEAVTYNMEDGKVVATTLDKASLFTDNYDEHHILKKFTFPNIKEGSIIEYHYTLSSPFRDLQPWDFQGEIPCLWSEYSTTIPASLFDYVTLKQGYLPYVIETATSAYETYSISSNNNATGRMKNYSVRSNTITARWAIENIPALKTESFVTTIENYKSRIDFQLRRIKYSETNVEEFMGNWEQAADKMIKREDFGEAISANNGWLNDDLKLITAGTKDDYAKAKQVFDFIREKFTCADPSGIYIQKPLKKTFEDKNGTVADINLLLIAALKKLNFEAKPAILSTRSNGWASELYPLMSKFNYVICSVKIGDDVYLLDASDKKTGFGKLPERAYNGSARIIDQVPNLIDLSPDSLTEKKFTTLFMTNKDKNVSGTLMTTFGDFESHDTREKLAGTQTADYLKDLKKSYSFDVDLSNMQIDSLNILEKPLTVKYDIGFNFNDEDIVYFNPILPDINKENPFKASDRYYPVEMPSCTDETYVLNMEVPEGYTVDELPKSTRVMLNENEGMFEYIIGASNGHIQLRCRTVIKKATFEPEDYQTLRDFFGFIVNKESEQIVFKKIK